MNATLEGVKPNTLTRAQITAKLAQVRTRGTHPQYIKDFIASGALYQVVNEHPSYAHFNAEDLDGKVKQGLTVAFKTLKTKNLMAGITTTPEVQVMFDADDSLLYVINLTLHQATDDNDAA